ncbi:hypothetical protein ACIA5H_02945 [Nocardia sp. NPDC051900]|uniref:hypothetical protein n=1 Tax=Nocardia sp. NPDC051900 TaxID=3364326 RepID=UPI0037A3DD81
MVPPRGSLLMEIRESMGLGRKAFAARLDAVVPRTGFSAPITWHSIHAWELVIGAPDHVLEAAVRMALGVTHTVVDLDAVGVSA